MSLICTLVLMCLCGIVHARGVDLSLCEKSFFSSHGEDGILQQIFSLIQPGSGICVEFNAGDGFTNSMTYFLRIQNWQGYLFDPKYDIPIFNLHKETIFPLTLNQVLEKYRVPKEFDLLVIDSGFNDFYLWQSLDPRYRPSVVCIAYNGYHPPQEDKVVPLLPLFSGDDTTYFGASILALYHLGRSKQYDLVYAEASGSHLFFIRKELIEKNDLVFKNANDVAALYRPANEMARRKDSKQRKYVSSQEALANGKK